MYHDHPENVFYGTDDGAQDGSFSEFAEIKAHYDNVAPQRHEDIHMISVVGGLYGLNLIPLWKPSRITIFDINPTAITYFQIIRRVFTTSRDVAQFLQRLTDGDYEVETEREEFVRENIILKQRGNLPRERGSELALRHRLPLFVANTEAAQAGALMAYGADNVAVYRQSATFVDKILKGRKPADLPVELATKFRLIVNLKTANALGLTLSPGLLNRADEVIE